MEIQWEAPPPAALERQGSSGGHYVEFADALRERPKEWALMPPPSQAGKTERTPSSANALAQNIRRGKVKGFNRGEFETVAHGGKVWVRFLGAKAEPVTPDHDDLARKARDWARDQGMNVPTRGALSREVILAYCKAKGITPPGPRATTG